MSLLYVHALGVCTSEWPSIGHLQDRIAISQGRHHLGDPALRQDESGNIESLENLDAVSQWVFPAITQAWRGAHLDQGLIPTQRIALILSSAWGQVDATVTYLESMWAEGGRFASPRQFTRSVHSSPTALAAIHFGIHGPCYTLVHDAWPVCAVLEQAGDLLQAGHADAVVACWADQASVVAADLCRRAARDLHRSQFARFTGVDRHGGAVAAVVSCNSPLATPEFAVEIGPVTPGFKPSSGVPVVKQGAYPTDGAFHWAAAGIAWSLAAGKGDAPIKAAPPTATIDYWREFGHHGQMRQLTFRAGEAHQRSNPPDPGHNRGPSAATARHTGEKL